MQALQRIAGPVVAQREELLRVTHRGRERYAARLELAPARQRDVREAVAPRQRDEVRRQRQAREPLHEAERVGPAEREARELDAAAPARREGELQLLPFAGAERRELAALHVARQPPVDLPAPAK